MLRSASQRRRTHLALESLTGDGSIAPSIPIYDQASAMSASLNRQQLISMVQKLMQGEGDEQEIAEWEKLIDRSVPCPSGYVFDLIFYPDRHDLGGDPTAEKIVEKALSYKPIQLP
jgi:hypothetical protein